MGFWENLVGTKLQLSQAYTLEELYERIKDVPFAAGTPEIAYHGPTAWIVFPQLDRNNQVGISGKNGRFTVIRLSQPIGLDQALGNVALDSLTNGLSSWSAVFGSKKKRCEELVRKAADQINAMHL